MDVTLTLLLSMSTSAVLMLRLWLQVYIYEYDDDLLPVGRPRQVLPYAVLHFKHPEVYNAVAAAARTGTATQNHIHPNTASFNRNQQQQATMIVASEHSNSRALAAPAAVSVTGHQHQRLLGAHPVFPEQAAGTIHHQLATASVADQQHRASVAVPHQHKVMVPVSHQHQTVHPTHHLPAPSQQRMVAPTSHQQHMVVPTNHQQHMVIPTSLQQHTVVHTSHQQQQLVAPNQQDNHQQKPTAAAAAAAAGAGRHQPPVPFHQQHLVYTRPHQPSVPDCSQEPTARSAHLHSGGGMCVHRQNCSMVVGPSSVLPKRTTASLCIEAQNTTPTAVVSQTVSATATQVSSAAPGPVPLMSIQTQPTVDFAGTTSSGPGAESAFYTDIAGRVKTLRRKTSSQFGHRDNATLISHMQDTFCVSEKKTSRASQLHGKATIKQKSQDSSVTGMGMRLPVVVGRGRAAGHTETADDGPTTASTGFVLSTISRSDSLELEALHVPLIPV